jgi:transcriptional regulator with PAS, ATPase and Fis domain
MARTHAAEGRTTPASSGDDLFGNSPAMRPVKALIERVAPTDASVLVWGESGVGKELVARAIHEHSARRTQPFLKINSAAVPAELLESELFGYERGAFTGAHRMKPGKFELATSGTIFLDEIGEMPLGLQAKLLNVLEDREVSRLGAQRSVAIDVRVVAATNKDLAALVKRGAFRDDLYYRLNVMSIHVPPLRERREEIPILVERFLSRYAGQYRCPRPRLRRETMRLLAQYEWPGNVRELENWVRRIVVLRTDDWVADGVKAAVEPPVKRAPAAAAGAAATPPAADGPSLKEIGRRAAILAEGQALRETLQSVHWHRLEAARRLKVSYKTLLQKMKQSGL